MIEHVVAKLVAEGTDDVVLSLGYRPDAFGVAYPSGRCAGAGLRYATEPEPLGTAGALAFAARRAAVDNGRAAGGDPFSETFWALNGDVLTDAPLSELLALHRARGAEATILTIPMADASRYGLVESDRFGARLAVRREAGHRRGGERLDQRRRLRPGAVGVLARIPPDEHVSMERRTFKELAAELVRVVRAALRRLLDRRGHARLLPAGQHRPRFGPPGGHPGRGEPAGDRRSGRRRGRQRDHGARHRRGGCPAWRARSCCPAG